MILRSFTIILFSLSVITWSCSHVSPAGFWENFQKPTLVGNISSYGPYGGHKVMHWQSNQSGTFTAKEIIDFARQKGWTFVDSASFSKANINKWQYNKRPIFPLAHDGFDALSQKNNATYEQFPRSITSDITLLKFNTNWITVQPGTGADFPAYGYVILNKEQSEMAVYHLWGE